MIASDPVQAMQLQQQQRALEAQRNQVAQAVTQRQQQKALVDSKPCQASPGSRSVFRA
jgi:hypothetical protein